MNTDLRSASKWALMLTATLLASAQPGSSQQVVRPTVGLLLPGWSASVMVSGPQFAAWGSGGSFDITSVADRARIFHLAQLGHTAESFAALANQQARANAIQTAENLLARKVAHFAEQLAQAKSPPARLSEIMRDLGVAQQAVPELIGAEVLPLVGTALRHGRGLQEQAAEKLQAKMEGIATTVQDGRSKEDDLEVSRPGVAAAGTISGEEARQDRTFAAPSALPYGLELGALQAPVPPAEKDSFEEIIAAIDAHPASPRPEDPYIGEDADLTAVALEDLIARGPSASGAETDRAVTALISQHDRLTRTLMIEERTGSEAAWGLTQLNLAALAAYVDGSRSSGRAARAYLMKTYVYPVTATHPRAPEYAAGALLRLESRLAASAIAKVRESYRLVHARVPDSRVHRWLIAKYPVLARPWTSRSAAREFRKHLRDGEIDWLLPVTGTDSLSRRKLFTLSFTLLVRHELPALERVLSPEDRRRMVASLLRRMEGLDVRTEDKTFTTKLSLVHALMGVLPWLDLDERRVLAATVQELAQKTVPTNGRPWPYTYRRTLARFAGELAPKVGLAASAGRSR